MPHLIKALVLLALLAFGCRAARQRESTYLRGRDAHYWRAQRTTQPNL